MGHIASELLHRIWITKTFQTAERTESCGLLVLISQHKLHSIVVGLIEIVLNWKNHKPADVNVTNLILA